MKRNTKTEEERVVNISSCNFGRVVLVQGNITREYMRTEAGGIKMEKNLYKVKVLNFIPFGGKAIVYWIHANSGDEAKLLVAKKFNKEFHFDPQKNYVDMRIIDWSEKKKEGGEEK